MLSLEGIVPPMLSCFDDSGNLDKSVTKEYVNYLIDGGVHGLFPCSTTGEFSSMNQTERKKLIEITVDEAAERVPVLPGIGSSSIDNVYKSIRHLEQLGVDGCIVVTPYYLKPSQKGLFRFYKSLAEFTDLPIILYQIPETTGVHFSVETVVKLAQENENIVGLKDSSGDFKRFLDIKFKTNDEFCVFQGIDQLLLPSLKFGVSGGMCGSASIKPEIPVRLFENFKKGNKKEAEEIQFKKVNKLIESSIKYGTFPAGIKAALREFGINAGPPKPPINDLSPREKGALRDDLRSAGWI